MKIYFFYVIYLQVISALSVTPYLRTRVLDGACTDNKDGEIKYLWNEKNQTKSCEKIGRKLKLPELCLITAVKNFCCETCTNKSAEKLPLLEKFGHVFDGEVARKR